jgi:protein-S-isoprenylcysteine O-methyltransferase Ste14
MRLPASRAFSVLLIALILLTKSGWDQKAPTVDALLFAMGITLVAIGSIGRLWCSLYIAGYKTYTLIDLGPYSVSRHPLYFFSLIGAIGVGFATETITIPAILAIAFPLAYWPVMQSEEKKLLKLHPEAYSSYMKRVPKIFPKWSLLSEPDEYVVNPRLFKKHIFSALWFIWLTGIMEIIEVLRELSVLPVLYQLY